MIDLVHPEIQLDKGVNQQLILPELVGAGFHVDVKRLDLIHPEINGNKWFKLKYNIRKATESDHKTLLTFGGPWSNHIFATASAGKLYGLKTIGIIRGEEPGVWSSTLVHSKECGMQLEFITRLAYAEKETEDFAGWLHEEFGSFYLVPEGGSNFLGINGCMEILSEEDKKNYDYICCACGTGATLAGLMMTASPQQKVLGFSSLKHGDFLRDEVIKHLRYFLMDEEAVTSFTDQFSINSDYHFGGYGKWTGELLTFIQDLEARTGIPTDQVYTGKMMYGVIDLIKRNFFPPGSRILVVHSGGLQGRTEEITSS